jgi:hypothetical protein
MPAFNAHSGFEVLLTGWMGAGNSQDAAWFANPLLWASWIFLGTQSKIPSMVCSVAALLLGISFDFQDSIIGASGGNKEIIGSRGWGYFIWLTSMVIPFIVAIIMRKIEKPDSTPSAQ